MEAGKIYWIEGEFKILDIENPDYWHSFSKIETSVVDSNTIKLVTEEKDYGDGLVSIKITLNADKYDLFKGEAINFDSGEMIASVDAELFQNGSKYLLKGFWKESIEGEDQFFTWIAIIKKSKIW